MENSIRNQCTAGRGEECAGRIRVTRPHEGRKNNGPQRCYKGSRIRVEQQRQRRSGVVGVVKESAEGGRNEDIVKEGRDG